MRQRLTVTPSGSCNGTYFFRKGYDDKDTLGVTRERGVAVVIVIAVRSVGAGRRIVSRGSLAVGRA